MNPAAYRTPAGHRFQPGDVATTMTPDPTSLTGERHLSLLLVTDPATGQLVPYPDAPPSDRALIQAALEEGRAGYGGHVHTAPDSPLMPARTPAHKGENPESLAVELLEELAALLGNGDPVAKTKANIAALQTLGKEARRWYNHHLAKASGQPSPASEYWRTLTNWLAALLDGDLEAAQAHREGWDTARKAEKGLMRTHAPAHKEGIAIPGGGTPYLPSPMTGPAGVTMPEEVHLYEQRPVYLDRATVDLVPEAQKVDKLTAREEAFKREQAAITGTSYAEGVDKPAARVLSLDARLYNLGRLLEALPASEGQTAASLALADLRKDLLAGHQVGVDLAREEAKDKTTAQLVAQGIVLPLEEFLALPEGEKEAALKDLEADACTVLDLARAMAAKLAAKRLDGRKGWRNAPPAHLANLLFEHLGKGDLLDVVNLAMMLRAVPGGSEAWDALWAAATRQEEDPDQDSTVDAIRHLAETLPQGGPEPMDEMERRLAGLPVGARVVDLTGVDE